MRFTAIVAASAMCVAVPAQANPAEEIRAAVHEYLDAWSYEPGELDEKLNRLEGIFNTDENGIVTVDNFGDQVTVKRSYSDYIAEFLPIMRDRIAFQEVSTVGPIKVRAAEDFAVATFVLRGVGELTSGEKWDFRQAATFVWEQQNGEWRLVREHLTTLPEDVTLGS